MERQKNNPSIILTSDWHLREDTPVCRTDDYWSAQWRKVDFISNLQKKYNCPVLHAGDLFDHWKPSPNLLRETAKHIPNQFYTCYGQHDLPQHSLDLTHKCGIDLLKEVRKIQIADDWTLNKDVLFCHWGQDPKQTNAQILVWHKMNYQGKLPYPGCVDPSSASLLRKHLQFDLILTGDNHKTFTEEFEGRRLVNPGALMRMEADEINHKPCVFLWYAETNNIEQIFIPIDQDVISREHIEKIEQRDARIDAYISKFDMEWESKFTFKENLENFKKVNTVRESVMELIYRAID